MKILPFLLLSMPLSAGTVVLSDTEFQPGNWTPVLLDQTSGVSVTFTQQTTGGNPDAYRQAAISAPAHAFGETFSLNAASFGALLTYNPSASGAISGLQFDYDVAEIGYTGFVLAAAGGYRPQLRQNGRIYFPVAGLAADSGWTPFTYTSLNASDWQEINAGSTLPDFSASGSTIEFGYRVLLVRQCPNQLGCPAGVAFSGIDNYRVTITNADAGANVPEPSTLALTAASLLSLGIISRRSRRA